MLRIYHFNFYFNFSVHINRKASKIHANCFNPSISPKKFRSFLIRIKVKTQESLIFYSNNYLTDGILFFRMFMDSRNSLKHVRIHCACSAEVSISTADGQGAFLRQIPTKLWSLMQKISMKISTSWMDFYSSIDALTAEWKAVKSEYFFVFPHRSG